MTNNKKIYFEWYQLPKWYDNYENTVTSVEYLANKAFILVEVRLEGEGHKSYEYSIWTYELLESNNYGDKVNLTNVISEWSL